MHLNVTFIRTLPVLLLLLLRFGCTTNHRSIPFGYLHCVLVQLSGFSIYACWSLNC